MLKAEGKKSAKTTPGHLRAFLYVNLITLESTWLIVMHLVHDVHEAIDKDVQAVALESQVAHLPQLSCCARSMSWLRDNLHLGQAFTSYAKSLDRGGSQAWLLRRDAAPIHWAMAWVWQGQHLTLGCETWQEFPSLLPPHAPCLSPPHRDFGRQPTEKER